MLSREQRAAVRGAIQAQLPQAGEDEAALLRSSLERLVDRWEEDEREESTIVHTESTLCAAGEAVCPKCGGGLSDPDDRGWYWEDGFSEAECGHCGTYLTGYATEWVIENREETEEDEGQGV